MNVSPRVLNALDLYRRCGLAQKAVSELNDQLYTAVAHMDRLERQAYDHIANIMLIGEQAQEQPPQIDHDETQLAFPAVTER